MRRSGAYLAMVLLASAAAGFLPISSFSAEALAPAPTDPAGPAVTYADLADLADSAPLVLRARVSRLALVEPERSPGLRPGWGRFYVEAKTRALIAGNAVLGESQRYLADLPLDAKGRPPKLRGQEVLLFAAASSARPGELQLIAPDAQIPWDAAIEGSLRAILIELHKPGAPARISGVREVIYVPGTLAGEGETQIFLATRDDSAATITVSRHAGQPSQWGASFSEVYDPSARPPARETLAWYRLACFLPAQLPSRVNLSATIADKRQAEADYRLVRRDLGECPRLRK